MSQTFTRFLPASASGLATGLALYLLAAAPFAYADSPEETITERLNQTVPGLRVDGVSESAVPGLYEVRTNNRSMIYATESGEYIIAGIAWASPR